MDGRFTPQGYQTRSADGGWHRSLTDEERDDLQAYRLAHAKDGIPVGPPPHISFPDDERELGAYRRKFIQSCKYERIDYKAYCIAAMRKEFPEMSLAEIMTLLIRVGGWPRCKLKVCDSRCNVFSANYSACKRLKFLARLEAIKRGEAI